MSNLIDANELLKAKWNAVARGKPITFDSLVKDAPKIDVVEVVRCKDCIHNGLSTCFLCYIEKQTLTFINHDENFYCAKGEKKDE